MMKKLSILMLAVAGMLFAACSSDKEVAETPVNPLETATKGYFKVNVNLPTTGSMRATWENSNLEDGEDEEYGVDNIMLLLFEGDNESNAELFQIVDLVDKQEDYDEGANPNQITTRGTYVTEVSKRPATGKKFYALAIVNGTGVVEHGKEATSLRLAGSTTETTNVKLSTLQDAIATSSAVNSNSFVYTKGTGASAKKYFFMTNAVLSTEPVNSTTPKENPTLQVLAPVDAKFIYSTEEAASASTATAATDIYVERGVAKVTLSDGTNALSTDDLKVVTDGTATTLTASVEKWTLDGTNTQSYIVRKVPTGFKWNLVSKANDSDLSYEDKYRFVGANTIGGQSLYRTYWAEDPNYNTDWNTAYFSDATAVDNDKDDILYAFENTFTVAQMKTHNTTRAILKVKLGDGAKPFYVIGNDRQSLYKEDGLQSKVVSALFSQSAFKAYWNAYGDPAKTLVGSDLTITFNKTTAGEVSIEDITIKKDKYKTDPGADVSVKGLTLTKAGGDDADFTGSDALDVLNSSLGGIEQFVGGEVYYVVRIQHFGDALTPWNKSEYGTTGTAPAEGDVDAIYPDNSGTRDANYLGRYGMVRNNWYDISLGKILKIGSATMPTLDAPAHTGTTPPDPDDPDHPDDELGLYIQARINILSWAKRTQAWDLH